MVAVWVGDRVLVLRQSYRVHLNLPGGGIEKGETPIEAALRELREEVGLELPPEVVEVAWVGEALWDWRHDHVTIFEVHLDGLPPLRPDGREGGGGAADQSAGGAGWPAGTVRGSVFTAKTGRRGTR